MTVLVQDLDSYNGVRVNGNRIVGQCNLAADDTIQIGDYLLALEAKPLEIPARQDVTRVTAPSSQRTPPRHSKKRIADAWWSYPVTLQDKNITSQSERWFSVETMIRVFNWWLTIVPSQRIMPNLCAGMVALPLSIWRQPMG